MLQQLLRIPNSCHTRDNISLQSPETCTYKTGPELTALAA
jgi:hypothetical protein